MTGRHFNPEGLYANSAYSQGVVIETPAKTIYVGGQIGIEGVVDSDAVGPQAKQALHNIATVLEAEEASLANVVRWTVAIVDGQSALESFAAFQQAWDPTVPPPTISHHIVAGLANRPNSSSRSTPSPSSEKGTNRIAVYPGLTYVATAPKEVG